MRHAPTLLALALAIAALPGQEPYRYFDVTEKAYSTDEDEWDLEDGYARQPYLEFSCTSLTGRDGTSTGVSSSYRPEPERLAATMWNWDVLRIANWSSGEGYVVIGEDTDTRIEVRQRYHSTVQFIPAEVPALLRAVREANSPIRVRVVDKASDAYITMPDLSFQTDGLDVCRLAYACGDQAAIASACGLTVQPPAPSLKLLKQDIQTVLDRYPTN